MVSTPRVRGGDGQPKQKGVYREALHAHEVGGDERLAVARLQGVEGATTVGRCFVIA